MKDHPEDTGGVFISIQAVLAASIGQNGVAENKIKSAIEKGKGFGHFHHTAYHIACAYAVMNKPEQAIKWLEAPPFFAQVSGSILGAWLLWNFVRWVNQRKVAAP